MRIAVPIIPPVVAAILLLAGCSGTEAGTPVAGDTTTTTTTTTSGSEPSTSSSRPKAIDMAALDVCQLFSQLPVQQFGMDGDRPPIGGDSSLFPGSKDCYANGVQANLGLTLIAVVTEGAADFAESAPGESSETGVAGYRTFVLKQPGQARCFGAVDVNDGQMLFISYGISRPGDQPVTPQAQLCERIPDIAAAALTVLTG